MIPLHKNNLSLAWNTDWQTPSLQHLFHSSQWRFYKYLTVILWNCSFHDVTESRSWNYRHSITLFNCSTESLYEMPKSVRHFMKWLVSVLYSFYEIYHYDILFTIAVKNKFFLGETMSHQSPTDINKQTYLSYTSHNSYAFANLGQSAFPDLLRQTDLLHFCTCIPEWFFSQHLSLWEWMKIKRNILFNFECLFSFLANPHLSLRSDLLIKVQRQWDRYSIKYKTRTSKHNKNTHFPIIDQGRMGPSNSLVS